MARSREAVALRARVGRGQRWSAAERARYLGEFAASGLSAAAFRRKTGLPRSTFALWRSAAPAAPGFARVEVVGPASPSGITLVVRSRPGIVAELGGLDAASAASLLEVVLRGWAP